MRVLEKIKNKDLINKDLIYSFLNNLLFNKITRKLLIALLEKLVISYLKPGKKNKFSSTNTKVQHEKKLIALSIINSVKRAIEGNALSKEVSKVVLKLWAGAIITNRAKDKIINNFYEKNGTEPPFFLVISPGHECNLHCQDCYAASESRGHKLSWEILDKLITDAKKAWGIKLIVFSGGEPFLYKSNGKDILDIALKHNDLLFLAFTNGTIINSEILKKIRLSKNLTPALSVEGMEKTTDNRRGIGVFSKVVSSLENLKIQGVPAGISVTVNRNNYNEVLSDEFLDFFFIKQKIFYAFYFQYLPMGRNADFSLMPTPYQRLEFRKKLLDIIEKRRLFILDFWNHGTLVNGCIAAGRSGGYLHIDWNGNVMPCVFIPYSSGNILEIYENGGNITDIWENPYLVSIRKWQKNHGYGKEYSKSNKLGNLLIPCPYRDHYSDFLNIIEKNKAIPQDVSADELLKDLNFRKNMLEYEKELAEIFNKEWNENFLRISNKLRNSNK